jgi:diadenosine tetraphosphate (Ap4A) HIT family hydrolase
VLNGRQYEPGQCIVFPTRHAPTLFDLNEAESAAILRSAARAGRAITRAMRPEALLLYQNNGILAGQEVPHFHLHVVPRSVGSDWGVGPPHLARVQAGSLAAHLDFAVVSEEKRRRVGELVAALPATTEDGRAAGALAG